MDNVLHEFFAVTKTSVYRVSDERGEHNWPIVEKIALRKESKVLVGGKLGSGHFVGVARIGIVLYDEDFSPYSSHERTQRLEEVNTAFWGGGTSHIIALFLNKEEAITCSNSENLQECDPRWRKETNEVLSAIGDLHPVFIISRFPNLAFPEN